MKRMRLRPSLGQLRLQREAHEACDLGPEVRLGIEPEQLRASVAIAADNRAEGGAQYVQLELSFPPQYPHRPPKVAQVQPMEHLPCWPYDGSFLALPRLTERGWSSAMGVMDIIQDLLEALSQTGISGGLAAAASAVGQRFLAIPVRSVACLGPVRDDIDME
jgi:ubiquitin-protein ligase